MNFLYAQPFEERLHEQMQMLKQLTGLYDQGATVMVKLIATTTATIIELLSETEGGMFIRARRLKFPSPVNPKSADKKVSPLTELVVLMDDNFQVAASRTVPIFRSTGLIEMFWLNLGKWKGQKVFWIEPKIGYSREDLISDMRNDDGGAHHYKEPGHNYKSLALGQAAVSILMGNTPHPDPPGHYSAVRQIAHEIELALNAIHRNA